jgi:leucyl aminopeptidase (aminopeptidase T)
MNNTDRVLALEGHSPELDVNCETLEAWIQATERITAVEEQRKLPFMLIAVPTAERANSLGLDLEALDAALLPALSVSSAELESETNRVRQILENANRLVIHTDGHRLELDIQGRDWMQDIGEIPEADGPRAIQPVVNLPAGSVYTTVQEWSPTGFLSLPHVNDVANVVFHFRDGRVDEIHADSGSEAIDRMFDQHTGEPRRISHIGIGLNQRLRDTLGWPLVDEHRHGALFIAFGENRYLGGENESSLNVDFVIPEATLIADGRIVVENGTLLA